VTQVVVADHPVPVNLPVVLWRKIRAEWVPVALVMPLDTRNCTDNPLSLDVVSFDIERPDARQPAACGGRSGRWDVAVMDAAIRTLAAVRDHHRALRRDFALPGDEPEVRIAADPLVVLPRRYTVTVLGQRFTAEGGRGDWVRESIDVLAYTRAEAREQVLASFADPAYAGAWWAQPLVIQCEPTEPETT
jgi:hypothetical protein